MKTKVGLDPLRRMRIFLLFNAFIHRFYPGHNMTYTDVIAEALSFSTDWAAPIVSQLVGRATLTRAHAEAFKAVAEARGRGTIIVMNDWVSNDDFELKANGRSVRFSRDRSTGDIQAYYDGFPNGVVDYSQRTVVYPRGRNEVETKDLARTMVQTAVGLLFRGLQ